MTRADILLAMLASAGGRPFTPVQIQKAMFLLDDNMSHLVQDGPDFDFEPYDYGPFDADVYAEAEALRDIGLAVIAPSPGARWNTYAASDAGVRVGEGILKEMSEGARDYICKVSEWVRAQSFSGLVKSIYDAYPDMRKNSIFRG